MSDRPEGTPAAPSFFAGPEHKPFRIGNGPTGALLIHGFMGTPAEMRPLGDRLAAAGMAAQGPLLPGFGEDIIHLADMDRRKWLSAAGQAWQDVQRDHERTVLVGYSMGAAVALHLAVASSPDVLVLIAPYWRAGGWQFSLLPLLRFVVPSVAPFEKANFDDPAVRHQLAAIAPDIDLADPDTQQFLRQQVRLPLNVLNELRLLGKDAYRLAPQIKTPTLVIQGHRDDVVAPEATRRLVTRLGSSATHREIDSDHSCIKLDTPGAHPLDHDIVSFLKTNQRLDLSPHLVGTP